MPSRGLALARFSAGLNDEDVSAVLLENITSQSAQFMVHLKTSKDVKFEVSWSLLRFWNEPLGLLQV